VTGGIVGGYESYTPGLATPLIDPDNTRLVS
jgi:hypothetical protein